MAVWLRAGGSGSCLDRAAIAIAELAQFRSRDEPLSRASGSVRAYTRDVDPVARVCAIAGLVLAVINLGLNFFLWHRAGPVLRVTVTIPFGSTRIRIRVANAGRLPLSLRRVELRDQLVITGNQAAGPVTRWAIPAKSDDESTLLPFSLGPTEARDFSVDAATALAKADGAPQVTVAAWVERSDGVWYSSDSLKIEL